MSLFDDAKAKVDDATNWIKGHDGEADNALNKASDAAKKTGTDWDDKAVKGLRELKNKVDGDK